MLEIPANNLNRFMACNGSLFMPGLKQSITDTTIALRDEGNAAHYMAVAVFNGEFKVEELVDRKAPNGVYMSAEMADDVSDYLSSLDAGEMECDVSFGNEHWRINSRTDHISFNLSTETLNVDDLKYGWSIVEPFENWTLIAYAIGYCVTRGIRPQKIRMTIHQPRPYHPEGKIRPWEISYFELFAYYEKLAKTLNEPKEELRTGGHCRKCHALTTCAAARKSEMNALDAIDEMAFNDNVSNELLSFELDTLYRAKAILKNRIEAFEELAQHRIAKGEVVENYSTEMRLANTRWKENINADMLRILTGKDLSNAKLVTPAEAKRRGVPENVIEGLTERPPIGVKLARVSADKKAKRIFKPKQEK